MTNDMASGAGERGFVAEFESGIAETAREKPPWKANEYLGLSALILFWFAALWFTWADWGNLTIDCGREMYVPRVLAEGKTLYRDVWYPYGPAGPYFNALLFRIFGVHLAVLYIAGSLAALGSSIFLYLSGIEFSFPLAGWCVGAVVIVQAFVPTLFSFPVPYSFAAVYGCLLGCVFVWLLIRECRSPNRRRLFAIGLVASVALLMKPEYGGPCYVALGLMILLKQLRQFDLTDLFRDVLAILPGIVLCLGVIVWMLSLRGVDFIIYENVLTWPTCFFMRTYGKKWLAHTGLTLNKTYLIDTIFNTLSYGAMSAALYMAFDGKRSRREILIPAALALGALALLIPKLHGTSKIVAFYPPDMTLYVVIASAVLLVLKLPKARRRADYALVVASVFSGLLAFRMLLNLYPTRYASYYDGPVILCFLVLLSLVFRALRGMPAVASWTERFVCFACVGTALLLASHLGRETLPFRTDYGMIRVPKDSLQGYASAVVFMKAKAAEHESTVSIPEDTSLYFLSGTQCPNRVYQLLPGVIAPGRMTEEFINELETKKPRYLMWSNRKYPEYGAPEFGVDFDQPIGDYLRSHYQQVRPIQLLGDASTGWHAVVWERKAVDNITAQGPS
jgi:hypothetical protein